jgi:multiple sugar transport system substrate-binding protein
VLGGAGLAVSAASPHLGEAAAFAAWLAGTAAQRQIVLPSGGQPASRGVWNDPHADELAGGFFSGTRATIDNCFVRPRERWWPACQQAAGQHLIHLLRRGATPSDIHRELTDLLNALRTEEPTS